MDRGFRRVRPFAIRSASGQLNFHLLKTAVFSQSVIKMITYSEKSGNFLADLNRKIPM